MPATRTRAKIIDDFARWTALSALRSGSGHPKSRQAIYRSMEHVKFDVLFDRRRSRIDEAEFTRWHRNATRALCRDGFCVGWAAKIINVYLKTRVYLAGDGRPGLKRVIHPPIDNGLWKGMRQSAEQVGASDLLHPREDGRRVTTISGIRRYETYRKIIQGCRQIADANGWSLIEVESLWLR